MFYSYYSLFLWAIIPFFILNSLYLHQSLSILVWTLLSFFIIISNQYVAPAPSICLLPTVSTYVSAWIFHYLSLYLFIILVVLLFYFYTYR